jgi:hypothetical protein
MGKGLRRSKGLKRGFLRLFIKSVETRRTMVYNYLNSFNCRKNNGQTLKTKYPIFSKDIVRP